MLKQLFQTQDVTGQTTEPGTESVPAENTFKSIEEKLQELDEHLTQQLKEQSRVSGNLDLADQNSPLSPADPDQNTQEFIQLADFISKERSKKAPSKDPAKIEKIGKLQKYTKVKSKEFESLEGQKGLQINKAA